MTTTLASSGEPFSLMNILLFAVHVFWIFFHFFKYHAFLATSALCLVRCSLTKTFVPLSFLPCFSSVVLCFLLTNLIMLAGLLLVFLLSTGWHASMLLQSISIPLEESSHLLFCGVGIQVVWFPPIVRVHCPCI